jgi:hypothetical protein
MDEMAFEKLPDPEPRGLVRLQKDELTWLVFEVREQTHRDGHVVFHRADARLLWTENILGLNANGIGEFTKTLNAIQVLVDTKAQSAKFGPEGTIRMTVLGCGLGTVLMSAVVAWLMKYYPDVEVRSGTLSGVDATDENRERRNRFYRKHGFDVVLDDKQAWGSFSKARAGDLKVPEPRIGILALDGLVRDFIEAKSGVVRLARADKAKAESLKTLHDGLARQWRATLIGVLVIGLLVAFPVIPEGIHRFLVILFLR